MKDKQYILGEIRRTAALHAGIPLGQKAFRVETGITEYEWKGVHWARWGDALVEAGFEPLESNTALAEDEVFESLAKLVRKFGRFPVKAEILMESKSDEAVPAPTTLRRRFGEKAEIVRKLREYCATRDEYQDLCVFLANDTAKALTLVPDAEGNGPSGKQSASGYVYLVKSGRRYKIGQTGNHWQRKSELHKQTSEGIEEIHTIAAIDDAPGIERYWHERFKDKRQHGEWFELSSEDINAFKKRKWM